MSTAEQVPGRNDQGQGREDPSRPSLYVCLGASAGGLEALEVFFKSMAPGSGLTFIVVQHLSPDYKSMMVELLSKRTEMAIQRAEEGALVQPDSIYLIPPKKNLVIFHGRLLLQEQNRSKGINLPIDIFLRSLADDQGGKSVAIILSGTGSDGTRGVRAVKEAGGMVMVQQPDTAKFEGMPRSAISTGAADFILAPEDMPAQLQAYAKHPYAARSNRSPTMLKDEDGLSRIFALLRDKTKVDFTFYKPSTVNRRIERRMTVNQIFELKDYVSFLETHPRELTTLYRDFLIGVTSFFRDREAFEDLEQEWLPDLFSQDHHREYRFWVPGCATGEEAYSLAIQCRECMDALGLNLDVKIFATDLDREAIVQAGNGIYPESIAADVPGRLLTKYFNLRQDSYQVSRVIRQMVVFAQHNLIRDPPFTKLDLVSCRNLLIYLQPELQKRILELFSFALNQGGILFLGSSESVGEMSEVYEVMNQKWRIYRFSGKRQATPRMAQLSTSFEGRPRIGARTAPWSSNQAQQARDGQRLQDRFLQAVSEDYVPLAIVVNEQLEVLHTLGDTRGLLRLPSGKMQNDITRMTGRDLGIPLSTGLQKVFKTGREVVYTSINVQPDQVVDLRIKPLPAGKGQEPLAAVFIQVRAEPQPFQEADRPEAYDLGHEAQQRIEDLEQELQFTKENLQATIEELETSNEELQATNEELLASNEELQSTNEELQSVNEELHTLNAEYQQKINQLTELNNDMDNLLASADIATLFLDDGLEIRRFTPLVTELFNILETDLGRPLHYISHRLKDCNPLEMARTVLKTRNSLEQEVQSEDNRWYLLRVKPYLIGQEHPSGVVVGFTEVTQVKKTEADLAHQDRILQSIFRTVPVGIGMVVGRVIQWSNPKLAQMTGYEERELVGQDTRILYPSDEEYRSVGREKERLTENRNLGSIRTSWKRKDGTVLEVLLSFSPLDGNDPNAGVTFSAMELAEPGSNLHGRPDHDLPLTSKRLEDRKRFS